MTEDLPDSTDGQLERAKDAALGAHRGQPSVGDQVAEAAGGIGGVVAGASIGAAAGPVGSLLGGIAGALGGWWTGRAISEAIERVTEDDDEYYRAHFATTVAETGAPVARSYDDVRDVYWLGHIASHNPNFTDRMWDEVEPELKEGWERCPTPPCDWEQVRVFARVGYVRGVERRSWVPRRVRERKPEEDTDRRQGQERRGPEWWG